MSQATISKLDRPVDITRDHILGSAAADIALVEYGSCGTALACGASQEQRR